MTIRKFVLLALLASLFTAHMPVLAASHGEAASRPLLRISLPGHASRINAIAVDPQGRYFVTASLDKTARIWDASDGRLLNILRPPAADDSAGRLDAVAISPDGELVALAGLIRAPGAPPQAGFLICIFNRHTGEIVQRWSGVTRGVASLAWSPDGKMLVAGLFGDRGLEVFDLAAQEVVWRDGDFRDNVLDLKFNTAGSQLFALGRDGMVRRYSVDQGNWHREAKLPTPDGNDPSRIALSPDEKMLAVGYADSARVSVLDTRTLRRLFSPDVSGIEYRRGNEIDTLNIVAWSTDGSRLCAGGRWNHSGSFPLRCWRDAGRGAFSDTPLSDRPVSALRAMPDGRMLFATIAPGWGFLSATGELLNYSQTALADFRRRKLLVSHDGSVITTYLTRDLDSQVSFDVIAGSYRPPMLELQPPRHEHRGLRIENWDDFERPLLNKRALSLLPHDSARSAAISPDAKSVAIGGEFAVYLFSDQGKRLWGLMLNSTIWAVNFSGDGRWLISTTGDGIVRWHRMRDGSEALRLLPHPDGERWIMWTPSGYYSASIGAEDMLGWHVNRGEAAADFFPASRFRAQFNRPDIVESALSADSEQQAVTAASVARGGPVWAPEIPVDEISPPVVKVITPHSESTFATTRLRMQISIRSRLDAPATATRVRVNGQPVTSTLVKTHPALRDGQSNIVVHDIEFLAPAANAEISVFAENRHGISTPASVKLTWSGSESGDAFLVKPKLYVLAIGIGQYQQRDLQLQFAAKDARDFVNVLKRQQGQLYREVEVRALIDSQAGRDDILDGLEWLRRQVTHRDVGMLFMAGHGVNDADGTYYFLPHNADPDRLKRTGIIHHEIRNTLAALPGKAVFFVDTCHAGNVLGAGRRTAPHDISAMVNELSSAENGVLVFSASTGRQYSLENASWGNGAFTKALLEGMDGAADYRKTGRVTHKMLDLYVSERVKTLTEGKQTPVTIIPQGVPDFPLMTVMPAQGLPIRP